MKLPVSVKSENCIKIAWRAIKKVFSLLKGVGVAYLEQACKTYTNKVSHIELTSVSDAVPESAQSGGGELVQGVPPHLVPLAAHIQNHGACVVFSFVLLKVVFELTPFIL